MNDTRPSWDEYFMGLAHRVATRATCPRAAVGAVIVKDNRILGTGYNGSPSGTAHCIDEGCIMSRNHCIRTIHAEVNAILDALQRGSVRGATLYCTHYPCANCAKLIKQVGIIKVVYGRDYPITAVGEIELHESLDIPSMPLYTHK